MRWLRSILGLGAVLALNAAAVAQLTEDDLAALRAQGEQEGWTFKIERNPATEIPLEQLCGMVAPDRWQDEAEYDLCAPMRDLPARYDWRDTGGVTPIKNQGGCGSCWAFGTVGALECNIKIRDNLTLDLSEQWLVSCNQSGWSCAGGWWAHNYHYYVADPCGGSGPVLESAFPYVAYDAPCNCPYPHQLQHKISGWAYIGDGSSVAPTANIKQAIIDHGPVSVAIIANSAMQAYGGGVFNGCGSGTINHAVVLVGWDDSQGTSGVWFLRNSWGTGWGESGYMRIPYGCNMVGYGACYVNYPGAGGTLEVTPASDLSAYGSPGGPFSPTGATYTLRNTGIGSLNFQVTRSQAWNTVSPTSGTLAPGATTTVTYSLTSTASTLPMGDYHDTANFINTTNHSGDTMRSLHLYIGGLHQAHAWNLDTDPGWTISGGTWAWGHPTGGSGSYGGPDPTNGYTGANVYGYNLSGGYTNNMTTERHLTTTAIDCSNLTQVRLRFWRWLGVDQSSRDHAYVRVSNNGSSWTAIWENPTTLLDDQAWVLQEYDISSVANNQPTVYVRWTMGTTNSSRTYCGWNIDDVEIWGSTPCTAASISTHPQSLNRCAGQSATFSVGADGTTPLSYQWRQGGGDIGGATGSSYTISAVTSGDAGTYDCVVTNSCGSATSNAATLAVNSAPSISGDPQSQTRCAGQPVTFSVTASGTSVSYQWRKDSGNIGGATGTSYTISSVAPGDAGSYDCIATNSCGSATSNAATLTVDTAPGITGHPQSQTKFVGQSATFSVTAGGTSPSYQWRKDGGNIGGATSSSYTIGAVALGDAGDYDCVVTDTCGSATSDAATLRVFLLADMNCDGVVDNFDINPFVLALTAPEAYATQYPGCFVLSADINGDGVVDNFDINPFVERLTGK